MEKRKKILIVICILISYFSLNVYASSYNEEVTKKVQTIKINESYQQKLKVEEEFNYTATVLPESALDRSIKWRSDNAYIAVIDENTGKLKTLKEGFTRIYAYNSEGVVDVLDLVVTNSNVEKQPIISSSSPLVEPNKMKTKEQMRIDGCIIAAIFIILPSSICGYYIYKDYKQKKREKEIEDNFYLQ